MSTDGASRTMRIRSDESDYTHPKLPLVKPERNLLAAILGRAILDLYGDAVVDRLIVANARAWLYAPINDEIMFSFGWVAKNLDLDPIVIRAQLVQYAKNRENMLKCLSFLR